MAESLATYTAKVQKEVDDSSAGSEALIQNDIKTTYQEVLRFAGRYLLGSDTEDQTAVVGTASYTFSFQDIAAVLYRQVGGDFVELDRITEQEYIDFHINADNGTPSKYYINGAGINLVPAPDDAGTVRMIFIPITADVDGTSVIPSRFNDVMVYGASAKYLASDKDPAAVEYFELYDRAKKSMLLELAGRAGTFKPKFYGA